MHKKMYNSLILDLTITPKSPLLVKSGGITADPSLPDMQFVRTSIVGKGETIYIPGSSIKGVIRSYIEKVLKTLKGDLPEGSCNPVEKGESCSWRIEEEEKERRKKNQSLKTYDIYRMSCRACKMFGNTYIKSRVYFSDAYPRGEVKTETRYGVSISRLTHAVAAGPFDLEVLISGDFKTNIRLVNFEIWQLGLLALAFRGFDSGLVRVGFGKNRGFGEVKININRAEFSFAKPLLDGEIWGIGELASDEEKRNYNFSKNDKIKINIKPSSEYEKLFYIIREYQGKDWEQISELAISKLREDLG
jgi:CRISPR-associated RAMP protein (TIGR02581 family)